MGIAGTAHWHEFFRGIFNMNDKIYKVDFQIGSVLLSFLSFEVL